MGEKLRKSTARLSSNDTGNLISFVWLEGEFKRTELNVGKL